MKSISIMLVSMLVGCGGAEFSSSDPMVEFPDSGADSNTTDQLTLDEADALNVKDSPDSGKCIAGTVDCFGKTARLCDKDGVWQVEEECEFICDSGQCKGECVPGTKNCNQMKLEYCDPNGVWKIGEQCVVDCINDQCVGNWCCSNVGGFCDCKKSKDECATNSTKECANKDCCRYIKSLLNPMSDECICNYSTPENCEGSFGNYKADPNVEVLPAASCPIKN